MTHRRRSAAWLLRKAGSTRLRITTATVLVVGLALAIGVAVLTASLHRSAERSVRGTATTQSAWVESLASSGPLPAVLPAVDAPRLTLVQVVDAQQTVIAASSQLQGADAEDQFDGDGRGGPTSVDGARLDEHHELRLHLRGGPWFSESAPAVIRGKTVTVVVFTSLADYERAVESIGRALAIAYPILLLLVAGATWFLVGRALRPVDRMRREVDAITSGNLGTRIDEPPVSDEVGHLAVTLNSMLGRLQASADRQRRFIADASHELRTPVANIGAALDVARRYPDRVDWPEVADDLATQNQRMTRLVDDLLLVARTEHADAAAASVPEPADLAAVVRSAVDHAGPTVHLAEHLAVDLGDACPASDLVVAIAEHRLERVVTNLIENAVRHATTRVDVSVTSDASSGVLTVSDDGPGIAPDERDRVFEPFVRLDEHRRRPDGGAGLGLAIVRDLVTAAGGAVTVGDGPLGGASFVVTIPNVTDD